MSSQERIAPVLAIIPEEIAHDLPTLYVVESYAAALKKMQSLQGTWKLVSVGLSRKDVAIQKVVVWGRMGLVIFKRLGWSKTTQQAALGVVKLGLGGYAIGWRFCGDAKLFMLAGQFTEVRISWTLAGEPFRAWLWMKSQTDLCSFSLLSSGDKAFQDSNQADPTWKPDNQLQRWTFGGPGSIWRPIPDDALNVSK
jgi:hypothetical protein